MDSATMTFHGIRARLTDICRQGDMEQPDLIVDTLDGEFAAIWIESKLVVVIGEDEESDRVNPVQDPDFIEVADAILTLCDDGGFPRPDGAIYAAEARKVQFVWEGEFDATWDIDPLLASIRRASEPAADEPEGAGERLH